MRSILAAFFFICVFGIIYFYVDHVKSESVLHPHLPPDPRFVSISNGQLSCNGKPFYPKCINFVVSLRMYEKEMWPSIYIGYAPGSVFRYQGKDSSLMDLKAHFDLVRDMGYNTVRLVGIGEPEVMDRITGRIHFKASFGDDHNYELFLENEELYNKYFSAVEDLLKTAEDAGLKVIFTTKLFKEAPDTEKHLGRLTQRFKDNWTILAYDFFNEPLYFDSLERKNKEDVYFITKKWQHIVKSNAPYHLTTIGLACQREVFEWDPNLMNVDFISFHPYEYEDDQVRHELYWYHRFVKKPWIIGETGIPSNNDSIPYENQVRFAEKTLLQNYNCGGMGYSWWQFKDVEWGKYHQNYLGVVSMQGETKNSQGVIVPGTPKPVNKAIKAFDTTRPKGPCKCYPNYYNFNRHNKFRITGRLVDESDRPLEGGGALAWDEWWINHHFTTTLPDGTFELYSEYKFYHWMVSATLHEMIRTDCNPDTAFTGPDSIPTIRLGTIKLRRLNIPSLFTED